MATEKATTGGSWRSGTLILTFLNQRSRKPRETSFFDNGRLIALRSDDTHLIVYKTNLIKH